MNPEDPKQAKRTLLQSIQRVFRRQESPQTLFNGVIPSIALPPAPAPTEAPKEAQPASSLTYIDPPVRKDASTAQGVLVPSPTLDEITRLAWYGDFEERQIVYDNVDKILANCPEASKSRDETIEGTLNQECVYKVVPEKKWERDPEAIKMAAVADELWQDLESRRSLQFKQEVLGCRLDYGVSFTETPFTLYGTIGAMRVIPPFGMKINQVYGEFQKNQPNAYCQYDSENLQRLLAEWPEDGIIASVNQRYSWQPYGIPIILAGIGHANGLIRGVALMPDAREAGQDETAVRFVDAAGNSVDPSTLSEFYQSTRKARKNRGEAITGLDTSVFNGAGEMERFSSTGAFWSALDDFQYYGAVACALYGDNYRRLFQPEESNRSVMEQIDIMRFMRYYNMALTFFATIDEPTFERMIAAANWAYRRLQGRDLVDLQKVRLTAEWAISRTPEELDRELQSAIKVKNAGGISRKRLTVIASRALRFDPEEEEIWLAEEKAKPAELPAINEPKQLTAAPAEPELIN